MRKLIFFETIPLIDTVKRFGLSQVMRRNFSRHVLLIQKISRKNPVKFSLKYENKHQKNSSMTQASWRICPFLILEKACRKVRYGSITVPYRTLPHYTVCDRIFENTIVPFFVAFKHCYKQRYIKRYFFKNNSVTENIPLHLPLPLLPLQK